MEGITQSFELSGSKSMKARVTVVETYDILDNSSDISVSVDLLSTGYSGHVYYLSGNVVANYVTLVTMSSELGYHSVYIDKTNNYYPINGENGSPWLLQKVKHDADGAKTITVSIYVKGYSASGKGANGFVIEGSNTITLTHIPRASTVGATDANIGSVSMLAVNRKSTAYQHSIRYEFGQLSGYINADGSTTDDEAKLSETSIAFTVPATFYAAIPNAKYGVCTLTCKTYSGDTEIGESQTSSFVATAAEDACGPQVSGSVVDIDPSILAITGDPSKVVRYASDALCTIFATARNAATIQSKRINDTEVTDTLTIEDISLGRVTFSATDSRGYTATVEVTADEIPYIPLTCVSSGGRHSPTDGTAQVKMKGNYFNGLFGATANTLTARYKIGSGEWVSVSPVVTDNSYEAVAELSGLDYTKSFAITVEVSDKVNTVTQQVTIGKGVPVFDWGEEDFAFHVPVMIDGTLQIGSTTITSEQLAQLIAMLG